jgi:hypothetical protein
VEGIIHSAVVSTIRHSGINSLFSARFTAAVSKPPKPRLEGTVPAKPDHYDLPH